MNHENWMDVFFNQSLESWSLRVWVKFKASHLQTYSQLVTWNIAALNWKGMQSIVGLTRWHWNWKFMSFCFSSVFESFNWPWMMNGEVGIDSHVNSGQNIKLTQLNFSLIETAAPLPRLRQLPYLQYHDHGHESPLEKPTCRLSAS